ncbi:TRAP transporter small permease subunit [Fodinicurvata halophila]|uniref:TRAP transporter small permease protein n=1 Tax=Fodinicurvata halophila TaxID=1419723 RepID=A0ABV8UQ70_9PROT
MIAIEHLLERLSRLLTLAASLCLVAMMIQVCADVIAYNLLRAPIPGTAEIVAYYYMVGACFLPLPLAELRNSNIHVDLFYNMASWLGRRSMLLLAYTAQIAFFSILAYQSGIDALEAIAKGEVVFGRIAVPIWPGRFFLPFGFGLAAVVSLLLLTKICLQRDWEPGMEDNEGDSPISKETR